MKTKPFPLITAGLAVFVSPVFALEAPADDAPPPPAVGQEAVKLPEFKLPHAAKPVPIPQVETAFLGVISGEVPEVLADHLGLKPGEGIVVRSLVPDGPAAKSGIATNDVITKVAGKEIGSPQEITQQISGHKPGDKVTLDLIHKGKQTTLDVTLGLKPAEMAANEPQALDPLHLEGIPKELAERIRKAVEGNIGGLDLKLGADAGQLPPQMEEAMRDMKQRVQGMIGQAGLALPDPGAAGKIHLQGGAIRIKDPQGGSVEVKVTDGAKEVTIRDRQDNVTWSGPWDTAQDKAAAPDDVRRRVDSLNIDSSFKGNGLRLQMGQAPMPDVGDH